MNVHTLTTPEWIIQRCTQRWRGTELQYEDWPGFCEQRMTNAQMLTALTVCNTRWPDEEFRGHNTAHQGREKAA
jgi:hypothetical protein